MYIWVSIMKYIDHKCMPCMYQAFITNVQRMYSYICTNIYAYPNKETYISEYRKSRRASTRDQECKTQTHRRMNIYACTHSRTRTQNTHTYTRNKKANPPPPPFSLNHLTNALRTSDTLAARDMHDKASPVWCVAAEGMSSKTSVFQVVTLSRIRTTLCRGCPR